MAVAVDPVIVVAAGVLHFRLFHGQYTRDKMDKMDTLKKEIAARFRLFHGQYTRDRQRQII